MSDILELTWKDVPEDVEMKKIIEDVVQECFFTENIKDKKFILSVTLTTPQVIKELNKEYRNIDKETDVLSFPMFEKQEIEERKNSIVVEVLGDIVISIPRVEEQAKEYGHSFERELAYMVVHGFYHLMGYDHMEDDDKKIMREKEENVLQKLKIER